jgi:hypothetical protein
MPVQLPHVRTPLRQHEAGAHTASAHHLSADKSSPVSSASSDDEASGLAPNPLWAINAGLGVFIAAIALIIMFG